MCFRAESFFFACSPGLPTYCRKKLWQLRIKAGIFDLSHPKNEPSEEAKDLIRCRAEGWGRVGRRTIEELSDAVDIEHAIMQNAEQRDFFGG